MIPWYQQHMVWLQYEVSSSIILRDISFLINEPIAMAAILDFSILSKLLKGDSSTPLWISLWGCQTWIIRREQNCIKQNKVYPHGCQTINGLTFTFTTTLVGTLQSNEHVGHLSIYLSDKSLKPRKCRVFELEEPCRAAGCPPKRYVKNHTS